MGLGGDVVFGDVDLNQGGAFVVSGQTSIILGPLGLGRRPTKTFTLCNFGPITLSGAIVQVNPDPGASESIYGQTSNPNPLRRQPNEALWHTYDAATFNTLASGVARSLVANDLFRWWRIVGVNSGSSPTTVSGWCYASSL